VTGTFSIVAADPSRSYWGAMAGRFYACQGNTLTGRAVMGHAHKPSDAVRQAHSIGSARFTSWTGNPHGSRTMAMASPLSVTHGSVAGVAPAARRRS